MKSTKLILKNILAVLASVASLTLPAKAATIDVTLTWDLNQESIVAGYRLYYGPTSGNYNTNPITLGNTNVYRFSTTNPNPNAVIYFALKAYTANDTESEFSRELKFGHPYITSVVKTNSQIQVSFTSVTGKLYRVEQKLSVPGTGTNWTSLVSDLSNAVPVIRFTVTNPPVAAFYQIVQQ